MKSKCYFPMFIDLSDKNIVVVGGGSIAARRINTLLKFTRNITVIAPRMVPELMEMGKAGIVETHLRAVKRSDLDTAYMVLAATNDAKLDDDIYRLCKEQGIYVNIASAKEKCDFYFPGVVMENELVVGITASGTDHKKAKRIREKIEKVLKEAAGDDDYDE